MDKTGRGVRRPLRIWAVVFWIVLWQIASMYLNNRILLVSPVTVIVRLTELSVTASFWLTILSSFRRITGGFLLGVLTGTVLAGRMAVSKRAEELWTPILLVIRSIPVASFIILALVWLSSRYLAIFITFLMVFPIICANVLEGIRSCDRRLDEMAMVFRMPAGRRLRYLTVPQVFPYFYAGCQAALGLSWKAGISAEVIGMPSGTVGERLQQAKVYLDTPDMYAWTLVIILISFLTERAVLALIKYAQQRLQRMKKSGSARKEILAVSGKEEDCREKNLSVKDLGKQFEGHIVLEHFSAEFPAGNVSAVMAPSGAGKTTLLRILAGLEKADSGITELPDGKIGMMFQEDRLCEQLCGETNIRLTAPWYSESEVSEIMQETGLPGGTFQPVKEFSGGMKRRTALLRTLLSDARILFLDEPFQGLDEETRKRTAEQIGRYRKGRTLILVTHDRREAELLNAVSIVEIENNG